jgi:hypothetical protein
VYKKDFGAGTVTLGGNKPGGAGNMYTVFVDGGGSPTNAVSDVANLDVAGGRVGAVFAGPMLRVRGLNPGRPYTITVTDPSGRVMRAHRSSGSRGAVALSMDGRAPGVYVIDVRTSGHQAAVTTVRP